MTTEELERFWSYVIKTDSCWPWMGHSIPSGYGRFTLKGRQRPAHRIAYELTHDLVVPKELVMDHLCRNPPCVNYGYWKYFEEQAAKAADERFEAAMEPQEVYLRHEDVPRMDEIMATRQKVRDEARKIWYEGGTR